jgi:hypothetical protein
LSMTERGRILIGFTPAVRIEQFFRDLEKRGSASAMDRRRTRNCRTTSIASTIAPDATVIAVASIRSNLQQH